MVIVEFDKNRVYINGYMFYLTIKEDRKEAFLGMVEFIFDEGAKSKRKEFKDFLKNF